MDLYIISCCDDRLLVCRKCILQHMDNEEGKIMQSLDYRNLIIAVASILIAGCEKPVSYSKDIRPILVANCLQCHDGKGEGSTASGFSVESYDSLIRGTKFGPVVVPGSAISSTLYLIVTDKVDPKIQMPPRHQESLAQGRGKSLHEVQVKNIELWIDQGARNN